MAFPDFFAKVPPIALRDPLARFLGAASDGEITYDYADAVKLAGHSCPTVAGAWLMVRLGLRHLYGDDTPERGGIEVWLRDSRDDGVTGVIAAVAMLLTGAAPETGFGGIGSRRWFSRRDLLHFDAPIDGILALRRNDTERAVVLDLDTSAVPPAAEMGALFPSILSGNADQDDLSRFGLLWQGRVEEMLLHHADDPALVRAHEWEAVQ